jgi:hypothetical protein
MVVSALSTMIRGMLFPLMRSRQCRMPLEQELVTTFSGTQNAEQVDPAINAIVHE